MNNKLNNAIIKFYNQEIEPYQLAEEYFKVRLYSAAATYYTIQLDGLHECQECEYEKKSYCFSKLAECYLNQQKDYIFSNWQLGLIHDMCQEAIAYNDKNILAYLILGNYHILKNEFKLAYFVFNRLFMNLFKFDLLNKEYHNMFMTAIKDYFTFCDNYQIIKYDYVIKIIINYLLKNKDVFSFKDIAEITNRYQQHIDHISEYEWDIMYGNISKYYE